MQSYLTSSPDAVMEQNKIIFSKILEEHSKIIRDLIDWLIEPCLDFIRHECKLFITTSSLHLVHSFLNLFTCLLDDCISNSGLDSVPQKQVNNKICYNDNKNY